MVSLYWRAQQDKHEIILLAKDNHLVCFNDSLFGGQVIRYIDRSNQINVTLEAENAIKFIQERWGWEDALYCLSIILHHRINKGAYPKDHSTYQPHKLRSFLQAK